MKQYPDEGTLRDSRKSGKTLERSGIESRGYHDKKGTRATWAADSDGIHGDILNRLPPGTDIGAQHVSDTKRTTNMRVEEVDEMGYPGDGWEGV